MNLAEQVAIVTGGASGIGMGLCEEIGRRGGIAIVTDINADGAETVAGRIARSGGLAEAIEMDVTDRDQVHHVVDQVVNHYGRLDYYFNNAGIALAGEFRDMSYEWWERIISINLLGVIYGTKAAYSVMIDQGFGHIINVSSMAGIIGNPLTPGYTATKFAVCGLTQGLRLEAQALGVKVSLVCPGSVETNVRKNGGAINVDREALENAAAQFRRKGWFGTTWDVKTAAEYILQEVAKNSALILLPPDVKTIHLISRLFPRLVAKQHLKSLRFWRKYRLEEKYAG
jgi:NAD(P)-dependent dehydrogenase (short-subunit alcohol dehydrogenase family)